MGNILTDIQEKYRHGSICLKFIYINIGIFIATYILNLIFLLFNTPLTIWRWFELPADILTFLRQPWSIITYMFMHANLLHLAFNMLWLWAFGRLFLIFFSSRHFRGVYFLGGLCGGLLYILSYNIFPYFSEAVYSAMMVGASASILAITVAVAVREPEYQVNLMFIGRIRLKYVALIMVIADIMLIVSQNAGGHIAHLGGALAGWWFAAALAKGHDVTAWINECINWLTEGWAHLTAPRKPKMEVHYGKHQKDYDFNARKKAQSDEIDRILDKLKQSGYDSLTAEEKKRLFDAGRK